MSREFKEKKEGQECLKMFTVDRVMRVEHVCGGRDASASQCNGPCHWPVQAVA